MKSTINVTRSTKYGSMWDNKTLNEIASEIDSDEIIFNKLYDRNIIGEFFGTILAETEKEIYKFPMSKKLTYSAKANSDLEMCKGKHFSWTIKNKYLQDTRKSNFGFVICDLEDNITPYVPLEHDPVHSFSEVQKNLLIGKCLSEAFERKIISEIKKEHGKFLFCDATVNYPYVIIDEHKVFVSYAVAALAEEQLIRELDSLVFYQADVHEKHWFRLGLPYIGESSEERPAFS